MVLVDFRDQERNIRVHPVGAGVGHDDGATAGKGLLDGARDLCVQSGERNCRRNGRGAFAHSEPTYVRRYGHGLAPAGDLLVWTPGAGR
jgi:hypothetical protein